jgi:hypothetical protein
MITIRKIYKSLFYQKFMRHKLAKIGTLLVAGATAAHATGLSEETIPYTPEPTCIECVQDTSSQEQTVDQNYWTADGILTTPSIVELSRDRNYNIDELISGGNVTSITSPDPLNFLNGKLNFLINSERAREFYTEEARQRMIRTYQDLLNKVGSINANERGQARELSRESLERAVQDGFLTKTEFETILSGVYVIDKKGWDPIVGNYDAPMLVYLPEISAQRIGPETEVIRREPSALIDDSEYNGRNKVKGLNAKTVLPNEDLQEEPQTPRHHHYPIEELQEQVTPDQIAREPSAMIDDQIQGQYELRRQIRIDTRAARRIERESRRAERQAASQEPEQLVSTEEQEVSTLGRFGITADVLANREEIYGAVGVSMDPASLQSAGLGASLILGRGYGQPILLQEITTEPSPYGVYGHATTHKENTKSIGGALDLLIGTPNFHLLFGGQLTHTSYLEKNTAETIGPDGEVRRSNQNYIPQTEVSFDFRAGLEAVLKNRIGIRGIVTVNPQNRQTSFGLGASFRRE